MDYFQYDRLPDYDISTITYDTLDVKQKIKEPVVLKNCIAHLKQCFTLNEARTDWIKNKTITCGVCQAKSDNQADLRKDIRGQVQEQFHPSVESIQIIQGILTHKYNRKKRYIELISNTQKIMNDFLQNMKKRYHQSNSISSIIQKQSPQQGKLIFWAYCLLDKVKIITPVRILKCEHPECYELTSLLAYKEQQDQIQGEDKKSILECCHPGCINSLNISSLSNLINGLVLDVDLLNIMNKSLPCQFKFTYLPSKKQFDLDSINQEDPIIKILYDTQLNEAEKQLQSLSGFIGQVQALTVTVMQGDIHPDQEKILKLEMFKTKKINMVDPLTGQIIEFPVRCTSCTQYDRCADVRSFAASHILAKQRKQQTNKCLLCGKVYKCLVGTLSSAIVYFDQNILSKMFKDMSYQETKEFNYDGKQYMLEQFYSRQKLSKDDYIEELKVKTNSTVGEFTPIQCAFNQKKEIQIPLIIKSCPSQIKPMVDFDTFYEEMVKINFNIEEKGLTLCKCTFCNPNPIKSYIKSIFYHEALGEALREFKKSKLNVPSFKYDFQTKQVVMKLKKHDGNLDQTIIGQAKFQNGFLDMMDDAEYQELFQPKYFGGKLFQIIGMQQSLVDGVVIEHNKDGVKANIEENIKNLNKNANENLKKFKFEVKGMQVELNAQEIKLNRGTFGIQN